MHSEYLNQWLIGDCSLEKGEELKWRYDKLRFENNKDNDNTEYLR